MMTYALLFAIGCFGIALLMNLWVVLRAPGLPDKVLAADTMVINIIALIVLHGLLTGSGVNFEAAMLFAMTGFVSTVAFSKFMLRGNIIE
ncbi:K+/H+ antiporter subunit F [Tabrizicola sp. J26]|uniref:K+/H+ antiporter subunit F n=1 Tax=Alitabrizicola rongguiensis TaxID=2909234 RepID=UPI001F1D7EAF|nr:K+/H+ antiporter subunit F [Tabrizicola rongguiensis]MCF1707428.1 K+/H+ antiporter subunit F [Tabrizicola rongguiensis]